MLWYAVKQQHWQHRRLEVNAYAHDPWQEKDGRRSQRVWTKEEERKEERRRNEVVAGTEGKVQDGWGNEEEKKKSRVK